MKPGLMRRREGNVMTMAMLAGQAARARAVESSAPEQSKIQIGACSSCGGPRAMGCSCDVCGAQGAAIAGSIGRAQHWSSAFAASPGCYPNGFKDSMAQSALAEEASSAPQPYVDRWADFVNMDVLYSSVTSLPVQATPTTVNVTPQAGCFIAFYYRLIVTDPVTGIQSVDWTFRRPRIQGCPVACDDIDRDILGQFAMHVPEAAECCGMPLRAFLQRPSENLPLQVPFINGSAAALNAQVEVRGFCCSTRIC